MVVEIDGRAGGGQILRSALALSGVTGEAVRVEHVRENRPNPGLKHQHLACVDAAAAVCDATVEGAELGSDTVAFHPGERDEGQSASEDASDADSVEVSGGEVVVDVGTAGAITLVFETVLPLCVAIDEPIVVTATGGTDVAWSPTVDYYERVRLPLARAFGWNATLDVSRRGFYPVGGGEATLRVDPSTPQSANFDARSALEGARVRAVASDDLANADVAERLGDAAADALDAAELGPTTTGFEYVDPRSTGASVLVELDYANAVAGFSALGEPGKPAEDVAAEAVADAIAFHEQGASSETGTGTPRSPVVDRYAADQLVLALALAGGRVRPAAVTEHVRTNCTVARAFGYDVHVDDSVLVG